MDDDDNYDDDRLTFEEDGLRFSAQVISFGNQRPMTGEDMPRVLDFVPEAPPDATLMCCVDEDEPDFIEHHVCLRGGFLLYFDPADVEGAEGPQATYHQPPVGLVPLEGVSVELPPGGRRVFREHAMTSARKGYELALVHDERPAFFVVTASLGEREKWSEALQARIQEHKPTILRAGYTATRSGGLDSKPQPPRPASPSKTSLDEPATPRQTLLQELQTTKPSRKSSSTTATNKTKTKRLTDQVLQVSDDAELANAVVEFGAATFDENEWMDEYFQQHMDFDAPTQCKKMEHWQNDMKKSLKGAVLEQYEYFVQASGEMTTMGREILSLKSLIETQLSTIKTMKEIDFTGAMNAAQQMGDDDSVPFEPPRLNKARHKADELSFSASGSTSQAAATTDDDDDDEEDDAPPIHIPDWLEGVEEELKAIVRECRYQTATDVYLKSKADIAETMDKHERPTAFRLKKKQLRQLEALRKALDVQGKRIATRLSETLRRKNEALKQASKRERNDAGFSAVHISPCALGDDALYLQLLVRLGETQQAADAYAARRSLLLLETLNERPMSGSGSVDLVIYAAQLSQSFFSCLATSVEGFLDLFLPASQRDNHHADELSLTDSSLHSTTARQVPSGAVASIVLWCESEVAKFSSAFGGSRILANLALTPPSRDKQPRVLGADKDRKNALEVAAQCLEQAFLFASENLDAVGLPLTPRLAEYLRSRLKGCEAEVADLLDEQWKNLVVDWKTPILN